MMNNVYRDVALGLRSLRKNPILSITAILTLALGIGANTAIFTLLYGLVLRSLPTPQAWQLVGVGIASAAEPETEEDASNVPYRTLQAYEAEQTSFEELSSWGGDDVLMKDEACLFRKLLQAIDENALAQSIETKWQDYWADHHTFYAPNPSGLLSALLPTWRAWLRG